MVTVIVVAALMILATASELAAIVCVGLGFLYGALEGMLAEHDRKAGQ